MALALKSAEITNLLKVNLQSANFVHGIVTKTNNRLTKLELSPVDSVTKQIDGQRLNMISPLKRAWWDCKENIDNVVSCLKSAELFALAGDISTATSILESQNLYRPRNTQVEKALLKLYELTNDKVKAFQLWQAIKLTNSETGEFLKMIANNPTSIDASWNKINRPETSVAVNTLFAKLIMIQLSQTTGLSETIQLLKQSLADFEIFPLTSEVTVRGGAMRWLNEIPGTGITFGTPFAYPSSYTNPSGTFWWSGEAVSLIDVAEKDNYIIQLSLRHSEPAPIELALGVNRRDIYPITLDREDDSIQSVNIPIQLNQGLQTIHLWFLNNAIVNGKDRDATIQSFRIIKSSAIQD